MRRVAAADHQRAAELVLLSGCDVRAVDAGSATALLYAAGAPPCPACVWACAVTLAAQQNRLAARGFVPPAVVLNGTQPAEASAVTRSW